MLAVWFVLGRLINVLGIHKVVVLLGLVHLGWLGLFGPVCFAFDRFASFYSFVLVWFEIVRFALV